MREKIVVLDGEPIVRATIAAILESDGYEVQQTDNALEVIEIMKSDIPALIITNLSLPGISGHEPMKLFKKCSPDTPVLMVPGVPESDVISEWKDRAGFAIFPKPFMAGDLRAKVREMLDNKAEG